MHRLLLFIFINIKFTVIINFSFKTHILNTCYILSTVLDTGSTEMNKTQSLSLRKVKSSGAKRDKTDLVGLSDESMIQIHVKQGHLAQK